MMPIRFGKLEGRTVILYEHSTDQRSPFCTLIIDCHGRDSLWIWHSDLVVLEKYVDMSEGAVRWD